MTPEQSLERRREQARATLEAIRRARVRRAQERLDNIRRVREGRLPHATPAERRLRRACWRALVQLYSQGKIPRKWLAQHPGLAEDLAAAAQNGERTVNE